MTRRRFPQITWRSLATAAIALSVFIGILVSDTARAQVIVPARSSALTRTAVAVSAGCVLLVDAAAANAGMDLEF